MYCIALLAMCCMECLNVQSETGYQTQCSVECQVSWWNMTEEAEL